MRILNNNYYKNNIGQIAGSEIEDESKGSQNIDLITQIYSINDELSSKPEVSIKLLNILETTFEGYAIKNNDLGQIIIKVEIEDGELLDESDIFTITINLEDLPGDDLEEQMISKIEIIKDVTETSEQIQVPIGIVSEHGLELVTEMDDKQDSSSDIYLSQREQQETLLSGFLEIVKGGKKSKNIEDKLARHIYKLKLNINTNKQTSGSQLKRAALNNTFYNNKLTPLVYDTKNLYFFDEEVEKDSNGTNFINLGLEPIQDGSTDIKKGIVDVNDLLDCYSSTFRMRNTKTRNCGTRFCPEYENNNEEDWVGKPLGENKDKVFSDKYYNSDSYKTDNDGLMLSYKKYLALINGGGKFKVDSQTSFDVNIGLNSQFINHSKTNLENRLGDKIYQSIVGFSGQKQENQSDDESESGDIQDNNTELWDRLQTTYSHYYLDEGLENDSFVVRFCNNNFPTSGLEKCKEKDEITICNVVNNFNPQYRFASGPITILSDQVDNVAIMGNTCDGSENRTESLYKQKSLGSDGKVIELWIPPGKEYNNRIRRQPKSVRLVDGEKLCIIGYTWSAVDSNYSLNQYLRQKIDVIGFSNCITNEPITNSSIRFVDILQNCYISDSRSKEWTIYENLEEGKIPFQPDKNQIYMFNLVTKGNTQCFTKELNNNFIDDIIPSIQNLIELYKQEIYHCSTMDDVNKILSKYGCSMDNICGDIKITSNIVNQLQKIFNQNSQLELSSNNINKDYVKILEDKNKINKKIDFSLLQAWKDCVSFHQDINSYINHVYEIISSILDSEAYNLDILYDYLTHLKIGFNKDGKFLIKPRNLVSYKTLVLMDNYKNDQFFIRLDNYTIEDLLDNSSLITILDTNVLVKKIIATYLIVRYQTSNIDSQVTNILLGYDIPQMSVPSMLMDINKYYNISIPYNNKNCYYNYLQKYNLYDYNLVGFTQFFINSADRGLLFHQLNRLTNLEKQRIELEFLKKEAFRYEVSEESLKVLELEYREAKHKFIDNREKWSFFNKDCQQKKVTKIYYNRDELINDNRRDINVDPEFDNILEDYKKLRIILEDFCGEGCLISGKDYSPICFISCPSKILDKYSLNDDLQSQSNKLIIKTIRDKIEEDNPFLNNTLISDRTQKTIKFYISNPNLSDKQLSKNSSLIKTQVIDGDWALLITSRRTIYQRTKGIWIERTGDILVSNKEICDNNGQDSLDLDIEQLLRGNCSYRGKSGCLDRRLIRWVDNMNKKKSEYLYLKNVIKDSTHLQSERENLKKTINNTLHTLRLNRRLDEMVKVDTAQNRLIKKILDNSSTLEVRRSSNVPKSIKKAFRQINLIPDFDLKYSSLGNFIDKYGAVFTDKHEIYWNIQGCNNEVLCCKHNILLIESAYSSNTRRPQLLEQLRSKWGEKSGNTVFCKHCGESLMTDELVSNVEFTEEGTLVQGTISSESIQEQRESLVENVLDSDELLLYNEIIGNMVNNFLTIIPEINSNDARLIMNEVALDNLSIMSFSDYIEEFFNSDHYKYNGPNFPFAYSENTIRSVSSMSGLGRNLKLIWQKGNDIKIHGKLVKIIKEKILSYCQFLNKSLDECGHYLLQMTFDQYMKWTIKTDTIMIKPLKPIFKKFKNGDELNKREEDLLTAYAKQITPILNLYVILDSYKSYNKFRETVSALSNLSVRLFLSIPSYLVNQKNSKTEKVRLTWGGFPNNISQIIKYPELLSKYPYELISYFFSGDMIGFINAIGKTTNDDPKFRKLRLPSMNGTEEMVEKLEQEYQIRKPSIFTTSLIINIIQKLAKTENYPLIVKRYKWDIQQNTILEKISKSDNWLSFRPPMGESSFLYNIVTPEGNNLVRWTFESIDSFIKSRNHLTSKLIISYINLIVDNSNSLIVIPKKGNLVQSCCHYNVKTSYLQNLIKQYPILGELFNKISMQKDNYKKICPTKTYYPTVLPLEEIGNLNYYYKLDDEIDTALSDVSNKKFYENVSKMVRNKIKDIYLTFSFDNDTFGQKRVYKSIDFPEIYHNNNFWTKLVDDYDDTFRMLIEKLSDIVEVRKTIHSKIRVQHLDKDMLVNLLADTIIKNGGSIQRDLIGDKFKIELAIEIDNLLKDKSLEELQEQLLSMRSLVYENNTLKDNKNTLAVIVPDLVDSTGDIVNQILVFGQALENIITMLKTTFKNDNIAVPFEILQKGYLELLDKIRQCIGELKMKHSLTDLDSLLIYFRERYGVEISDVVNQTWKSSKIRNNLDNMKQFIRRQISDLSIDEGSLNNLFSDDSTINNKPNIMKELLQKAASWMKGELIASPLLIDRAQQELEQELNIEKVVELPRLDKEEYLKAQEIKTIIKKIIDEKYYSRLVEQFKTIIHLIYYNITSVTQKWNINNENQFIIDKLPIYNSIRRCQRVYERYSLLDLNKGAHLLEFISILNIYLYTNSDRIDKLGDSFYRAPPPLEEDKEEIDNYFYNLEDGLFKSILINNTIAGLTEKEMIEQAVKRNLAKQNKNKKKINDMDEEARVTHKIFRLHNLGEHFNNFSEEQSYTEGDSINRSNQPLTEGIMGTGDLDQEEAELLTNEYAEEPED